MKQTYFYLILFSLLLSGAACRDEENAVEPGQEEKDFSTTLQTVKEKGAYTTFFKPEIGWVGDVMPFYDRVSNRFFLFYLQDWRESGPIHPYYKVETRDFSTYGNNTLAIENGAGDEQDDVLGTGSVIQGEDGSYYVFYTGEKGENYVEGHPRQAVMLAVSTDLQTWKKDLSFPMVSASPDYSLTDFRDPFVFWDEEHQIYRMVVSSVFRGENALAHYTSADLRHWQLQPEPLYRNAETFMECADVFKMGDYWYILYSRINDPRTVVYIYNRDLLDLQGWSAPIALDGRNYYAAKTAADAGGNRFLCGWCQTFAGKFDSSDWGGALVVHQLIQDAPDDPRLRVVVPEGVDRKFYRPLEFFALQQTDKVQVSSMSGEKAYTMISAGLQESVLFDRLNGPVKINVKVTASPEAVFGFSFAAGTDAKKVSSLRFIVEPDNNNKCDLVYEEDDVRSGERVQRNYLDLHPAQNGENTYEMSLFIEQSVCVAYVNNKVAFSCRIYNMDRNPWTIFTEKGTVVFSGLKLLCEN